jgi:hypothetical protein
MAQDQTRKRQNIASKAAVASTQLWDAVQTLSELSLERAQSGNFADADFDNSTNAYMTPFLVGLLLDTVAPAIKTFMEAPIGGNGAIPRDILLQMRP